LATFQTSRTFSEWLGYIEKLHPQDIDMGLERVRSVYARLGSHFDCPVIIVGGTNGKGSTSTMLQSMLMQAGYRVGLYTSPHIRIFNERACINGEMMPDDAFVRGFEAVEKARGETRLTYFEFTTLAILHLFAETRLDAVILEVGLGGRLDAVNVIDADVAVVTNVDIDHVDYLGDTRDQIGYEKAGIFRAGRAAICGDPQPPHSLLRHAEKTGADLWLAGRDFSCSTDESKWHYAGRSQKRRQLDYPALKGSNQIKNASLALAALEALQHRLPVGESAVRDGLRLAYLPGRFQILAGNPVVILDVAHNPHAAAVLADNLAGLGSSGATHAVFGAMADKDIAGVIEKMKKAVDYWYVTDLPLARAASAEQLKEQILAAKIAGSSYAEPGGIVKIFTSSADALACAKSSAAENDKIVVFGSFWTVAGVTPAKIF